MSLWESIINALNPCAHTWSVIEKLRDNEEHPTRITLVRECSICGKINTVDISGPLVACQHKWKLVNSISIWPTGHKSNEPGILPIHKVEVFQCENCGETKSKKLTSEGYEEEEEEEEEKAA